MEDIIIEEGQIQDITHLEVITNQLSLIATMQELQDDIYDDLQMHKIRAINNAMIIIHSCQYHLFEQLKTN